MDHGEHISVWSLRRMESYRITIQIIITAVQVYMYKLVWTGLVCNSCMHVCVGELISITISFCYKFKIVNKRN